MLYCSFGLLCLFRYRQWSFSPMGSEHRPARWCSGVAGWWVAGLVLAFQRSTGWLDIGVHSWVAGIQVLLYTITKSVKEQSGFRYGVCENSHPRVWTVLLYRGSSESTRTHVKHIWMYAGHWVCPPGWDAAPHPWHMGCGFQFWGFLSAATVSGVLCNVARCFFAASSAWHLCTALVKVKSISCKRSSTVSSSNKPSIIWSRIFFWVQASEHKLHVTERHERKIKWLTNLLCTSAKVPALYYLIHMAIHVPFDGANNIVDASSLLFG